MKDKILKILLDKIKVTPYDYYPTGIEGIPQSAREIADMVKAFTEWLIIEQEIFMGELSEKYIINDNIHVNGKRLETLDELFDYWYDNIRKK
jgi:hypothetical protein